MMNQEEPGGYSHQGPEYTLDTLISQIKKLPGLLPQENTHSALELELSLMDIFIGQEWKNLTHLGFLNAEELSDFLENNKSDFFALRIAFQKNRQDIISKLIAFYPDRSSKLTPDDWQTIRIYWSENNESQTIRLIDLLSRQLKFLENITRSTRIILSTSDLEKHSNTLLTISELLGTAYEYLDSLEKILSEIQSPSIGISEEQIENTLFTHEIIIKQKISLAVENLKKIVSNL